MVVNGWEKAEHGCKWLAMSVNGWIWREMALNGFIWLDNI